jgi:hypothetical protein
MIRALGKTLFLFVLVIAGSVGLYVYHYRNTTEHQVEVLEAKNEQLQMVLERLKTDRRVAKILVTDQKTVNGVLKTTLLFVEYGRDGSALPAREFVIDGNEAHFDAEVIKFKDEAIEANDPLHGQNIMLFVRVYAADQAPQDGYPIDVPGHIPEIYRGADPKVSDEEQNLWTNFWKLFNDKSAREARGIRAAHGEGLYGHFDMDHVYTVTIRADGGTINEEPIEPIYREAIHHRETVQ